MSATDKSEGCIFNNPEYRLSHSEAILKPTTKCRPTATSATNDPRSPYILCCCPTCKIGTDAPDCDKLWPPLSAYCQCISVNNTSMGKCKTSLASLSMQYKNTCLA